MFHLVIAKGKFCEKYKIIKSGTYEELSKYTVKFNDSSEIREKNKSILEDFYEENLSNGDIVIMDDSSNNQRYRVLYKKHIDIVKELIKNQSFMQYIIKNYILLVSNYDYKAIMYYKKNDYLKHMRDFLKRRNYLYTTIRIIIRTYENYQKNNKSDSINTINKEITNKKQREYRKTEERKVFNSTIDYSIKNIEYYEIINSTINNGGVEEIFNDYSLDELESNLNTLDFKRLVKSGYRR